MTRPLIFKFTTSIPGWVFGDNAEYLWKIWWFKHALLDLHVWPLFSPTIYHPYGFNLAYGEITPTNTLLTIPITAVFGEVVTYNFLALLSFVLSGFAMYLLVCYLTGITDIDPIRYKLVFERFTSLERPTFPDIDVDLCMERRGEVIEYVRRKYGEDRVAQIITFGTLGAKASIRDIGRVLGSLTDQTDY